MIPVQPQDEPPCFDEEVRANGQAHLQANPVLPKVPSSYWKGKEYWREALPELATAYSRVCAFSAFRVHGVTGSRSVEHFRPKSLYPELAYEWTNFRFVCALMNGRKRDFEDVLDPFTLPPKTFDLVVETGKMLVHRECSSVLRVQAQQTINRLKLNDEECRRERQEHYELCVTGRWSIEELERQSPFVFQCAREQGLL